LIDFSHSINPDAVSNKSGGIFAQHRLFAEIKATVVHEEGGQLGVSFGCGNDFEQPHIAWWIEEVCAEKMLSKVLRTALEHEVNRDTGRIGADNTAGLAVAVYLLKNALFDIETFNYDLYHPVTIGNIGHIVVKIAGMNPGRKFLIVNRSRF